MSNTSKISPGSSPTKSAYTDMSIDATTGLSANTLGIDRAVEHRALRKKLLIFGVGFALLFTAAVAMMLYMNSRSTLKTKTFDNGVYSYTVMFFQAAVPVTAEGYNGLRYGDKATVTARPTTDAYLANCTQIGRAWRVALSVQIAGKERPVCTTNDQTYYTNLEAGGNRHMLSLSYTRSQADTVETIKAIMQSVTIIEHQE